MSILIVWTGGRLGSYFQPLGASLGKMLHSPRELNHSTDITICEYVYIWSYIESTRQLYSHSYRTPLVLPELVYHRASELQFTTSVRLLGYMFQCCGFGLQLGTGFRDHGQQRGPLKDSQSINSATH